jgi:two-component system, sensor histidine kinase LadS
MEYNSRVYPFALIGHPMKRANVLNRASMNIRLDSKKEMKKAPLIIVSLMLMVLCRLTFLDAAEPVVIDTSLTLKNISNQIDYIEDAKKKLTIADVANNEDLKWNRSGKDYVNFGYTKSRYWFRFTVRNIAKQKLSWLLEVDFPPIDLIDLYLPDGEGGFTSRRTGDTLPFSSRDIMHFNYLFKIQQKPGDMTCYLRIESQDSINFNLNVLSYDGMLKRMYEDLPIYWIFFGLMLIMLLYNLVLFITTREIGFLFLTGFIATYALFEFNFKGLAFQYLWPNATWWTSRANPFLVSLCNVFTTLFLSDFVGIRLSPLRQKRLNVKITILLAFLVIFFAALNTILSLILSVRLSLFLVYLLTVLNVIGQCAVGIYLAFIRRPPVRQARLALLGFSLFAVAIPVVILTMLGILPANFFTRWAIQLGASFTIIFLSYGMADKINSMKKAIQIGEKKYRQLVESTEDIVFTLNEANRILTINGSVRHHLGYAEEELAGMNFLDMIEEPRRAKTMYARQMVMEYIGEITKGRKRSARFRVSLGNKYSHEPKELTVTLEYTGDKDVGYAILGKASAVVDDVLTAFLESERYTYNLNNYLNNAELMSQRLVRNLYKFIDPAGIADIRIALREAIINSIEHGNLRLSFLEKTDSMISDKYFDLVKERQSDPALKRKKVAVDYSLNAERVIYRITDEGEGFDHASALNSDPGSGERLGLVHGRGMMMIVGAFDEVKFNKKGNQILLVKYFKK